MYLQSQLIGSLQAIARCARTRVLQLSAALAVACVIQPAPAMADSGTFQIGGPGITEMPAVCPAPFDKPAREELKQLDRGVSAINPQITPALHRVILELRIASTEYDDARLSRAIALSNEWRTQNLKWSVIFAELEQARVRNDIAKFSAMRRELADMVDTRAQAGMDAVLFGGRLIAALQTEAEGVDHTTAKSLLDEALRRTQNLQVLAEQHGLPEDVRGSKRSVLAIEVMKAWLEHDVAGLAIQRDKTRAAVDPRLDAMEKRIQLMELAKALYYHASVARGAEGLQEMEESLHLPDEADALVPHSPQRPVGAPGVSGILCVGHNMSPRSMYATQDEERAEGTSFDSR